jgi:hypothetical protein
MQFPDLASVMGLLVDFLFSEREPQVGLDRGLYRTVITALGGREAFVNVMYESVDPSIRALKGRSITTSLYAMTLPLLSPQLIVCILGSIQFG